MLYELVNRIGVDRVMTYNRGESTVIVNCLDYLIKSKKAVSCDIAELNPTYDFDDITANLVARIVNHIVRVMP